MYTVSVYTGENTWKENNPSREMTVVFSGY